jgi:hypothetical protein
MSADLEKRKGPGGSRGADSRENLIQPLPSNPALSIQRSRSGARILHGWMNEAKRLHKLARDTKREIHDLALQRHLESVADHIGRYC